MGDPASKIDRKDETFYSRFLPVFLLITFSAGIVCFGALLLMEGEDLNMIAISVVLGVLIFAGAGWTRRLISAYPVYINPGGLRVYGMRGGPLLDAHWFKWADITRVSRFGLPVVRFMVLHAHGSKRSYWIPLDLVNGARFKDLLTQYAGRSHPLTRVLYGN